MTRPTAAAGLLFLVLLGGQFCVAGPLSPALVDTFKARALAKRFHTEQKSHSNPSAHAHRRHRRQGQIRLVVNKDATNVSIVEPPQIVRPKVKLETGQVEKKEESKMGSMGGSNGTMGPRKGRTNRDIKAIIEADMESGDVDDGAVEFMIAEMEREMMRVIPMAGMPQYGAITFRDGKIDFEPGSSSDESTGSTTLPVAPPLALGKRDGDLRAQNTWEGHPSPYRPKKPYEPSKHPKSEDYADIMSKSLWFYQVQS